MLPFQKLNKSIYDRKGLGCDFPAQNDSLKRYAAQNQISGNSTTHVFIQSENPGTILVYVTLSTAEMEFEEPSSEDLRHFPKYPVSALRIGRLAASLQARGNGCGSALLGFTVRQALKIRDIAEIRILLVEDKDDKSANFYKHFGFSESMHNPLLLYLIL